MQCTPVILSPSLNSLLSSSSDTSVVLSLTPTQFNTYSPLRQIQNRPPTHSSLSYSSRHVHNSSPASHTRQHRPDSPRHLLPFSWKIRKQSYLKLGHVAPHKKLFRDFTKLTTLENYGFSIRISTKESLQYDLYFSITIILQVMTEIRLRILSKDHYHPLWYSLQRNFRARSTDSVYISVLETSISKDFLKCT